METTSTQCRFEPKRAKHDAPNITPATSIINYSPQKGAFNLSPCNEPKRRTWFYDCETREFSLGNCRTLEPETLGHILHIAKRDVSFLE